MNTRPILLFSILIAAVTASACTPLTLMPYPRHTDAPQAVTRLIETDASGLSEAQSEVTALGARAMPELYEQLEYADAPGRIRILEVAIKIAKPSSLLVAILEEAGGDKDPTVRRAVAFRAGGFPSLAEDTVPLLRTLLYDRDSSVRSAALTSLGEYPPSTEPLTFEEIAELAIDPDLAVAANAAGIAVRRADPRLQALSLRALPRLVEGLSSTSATDRATAAFAIGQYGRRSEGVIRPLAALIRDTEVPEVRLQAAIALVRIGTLPARKAAIPVLESFVESPDPKLRNAALVTLRAASKK